MATAVAQLPPNLSLQSAIYHFELEGATPSEALLNIPSPTKTEAHALDLYTWDGANWRWQACRLDSEAGKFMAHLKTLPIAVAFLEELRRAFGKHIARTELLIARLPHLCFNPSLVAPHQAKTIFGSQGRAGLRTISGILRLAHLPAVVVPGPGLTSGSEGIGGVDDPDGLRSLQRFPPKHKAAFKGLASIIAVSDSRTQGIHQSAVSPLPNCSQSRIKTGSGSKPVG